MEARDATQHHTVPRTPYPSAKNGLATDASSAEADMPVCSTEGEHTKSVRSDMHRTSTSQLFSDRPDASPYNFIDIKFTDGVRHQDSSFSVGLDGSRAWNVLLV